MLNRSAHTFIVYEGGNISIALATDFVNISKKSVDNFITQLVGALAFGRDDIVSERQYVVTVSLNFTNSSLPDP